MKTSVTMTSKDRVLFGVTIRETSIPDMLNITDLQEAYTRARIENGWMDKRVSEILGYNENVERIYYLLKETVFSEELKDDSVRLPDTLDEFKVLVASSSIVKVLKRFGVYRQTGTKQNATVWCNPYIWVLLALEMSPILYAKVVKWLTDGLIFKRIEAGDLYKPLSRQVQLLLEPDNGRYVYADVAVALNQKVFGQHFAGIRQVATNDQLKVMTTLEENLEFAMRMGWVKTKQALLEAIDKSDVPLQKIAPLSGLPTR